MQQKELLRKFSSCALLNYHLLRKTEAFLVWENTVILDFVSQKLEGFSDTGTDPQISVFSQRKFTFSSVANELGLLL